MRALLMFAIAIVLLSLVGWISFNMASDRTSVNIETEKIEADMESMKDAGKDLIDNTSSAFDQATDDEDVTVGEPADVEVDVDDTTANEFEPVRAPGE